MASKEDTARFLTIAGIAGAAACVLWWFIFYSRVIAFTGGGARDFSQMIGCLFYSPIQCVVVKGISSLAGYWPYEPFFLWLSGGAVAGGIAMRTAATNGGTSAPILAPSPQTENPMPAPAKRVPADSPPSNRAQWLVSAILSDGQILKFEISEAAPRRVVGRDSRQADVVIGDSSISRAHASIEMRDGALWISDLDSTNGTKLGGRAIDSEPQRLYPSDKVRLGEVVLTISTA